MPRLKPLLALGCFLITLTALADGTPVERSKNRRVELTLMPYKDLVLPKSTLLPSARVQPRKISPQFQTKN